MEVYDYLGAHGFRNIGAGDVLVRRRIEAIEAEAQSFEARGDDDHAQCGRSFLLAGHLGRVALGKEEGDHEYLIVEATHVVSNNYEKSKAGAAEPADYHCKLVCIRKRTPWRPPRGLSSHTTRIDAPQTATVVGPAGEQIHTDEYDRVRLQFHWDREGRGDQRSSAWVRVATNWAGGETGLVSLPRIGSEVIVQWLGGNPDRPIVTGGVHNHRRMPPWQLPQQKALTGLRSRELESGGHSNHLVLDDTAGRIQAQLKSDHRSSQLSLGHICRIEDNAGRKDLRGQGFELRTDGHGAVRAKSGLLISTEPRENAQAHITDMEETLDGLKEAGALHEHLSNTAQQAQAHLTGDQDTVIEALNAQLDGLTGPSGQPESGRFPEFQRPHLTLTSPVGIETQTRGSTHVASGEHQALTSGGHTSVSAGKSFLVSVKEAVRLFASNAGMKLVAASGDIDVTALKNSIMLLAKLDITQTANRITISAKEEVVINGGGSYTRWNAGAIVSGTNGSWQIKAASHQWEGPDNAPRPKLPEPLTVQELGQTASLALTLRSHPVGGRPLANEPYTLYKGAAKVEDGVTDVHGQLIIEDHEKGTTEYTVRLSNGHEIVLPVRERLQSLDDQLAARGFRAAQGDAEDRLRHQQCFEDD